MAEVDHDTLLPRVQPVVEPGFATTGPVRSSGALDLDDPRAGTAEELRAERARPERGQVDHQRPVEIRRRRGLRDRGRPPGVTDERCHVADDGRRYSEETD